MAVMTFSAKSGSVLQGGGVRHQSFMSSRQGPGPAVSAMAPNAGKPVVGADFFDTLMTGIASALSFQIFYFTENLIYGKS